MANKNAFDAYKKASAQNDASLHALKDKYLRTPYAERRAPYGERAPARDRTATSATLDAIDQYKEQNAQVNELIAKLGLSGKVDESNNTIFIGINQVDMLFANPTDSDNARRNTSYEALKSLGMTAPDSNTKLPAGKQPSSTSYAYFDLNHSETAHNELVVKLEELARTNAVQPKPARPVVTSHRG